MIIGIAILWVMIEMADYSEGKPKEISPAKVSIMHDDEVCIVRYGEKYQETFEGKSEYDNILDSNFVLLETPIYDILGENNGYEYEVKIDD